jgi:3',5'-cyclic AMP phosphodiesterase CpdA
MILRSLAHLSDLHFGQGPAREAMSQALCQVLVESAVDHVVVTGDITNKGRDQEMAAFQEAFAPLLRQGRMTVVPGNHDRLGEDAGRALMKGRRVAVEEHPGLYLVLVDSTAEHNRSYWACHGELTGRMLDEVDAALDGAPERSLVAVLMHHHLVALPVETWLERMSERLRFPYANELDLGRELLERVRGRCDLVLHGHRHVPREFHLFADTARPLALYNAGSSAELGRMRVFTHEEGKMTIAPRWMWADPARAWGPQRVPVMVPAPLVTVREQSLV